MTKKKRIVFASGNAGKAREIRAMFADLFADDVELLLQAELGIDSVEETGQTFAANALLKAEHAARASGLPALADDSGIEVDALDGSPGVRSARYAGEAATDEDNVAKLLAAMKDVAPELRSARFRCVLAYVREPGDPEPLFADGAWEGSIAYAPSGQQGFGYDPVFVDGESGKSAAELDAATKNARSHRGKALQSLRQLLGSTDL